jgi:hypothetical protein
MEWTEGPSLSAGTILSQSPSFPAFLWWLGLSEGLWFWGSPLQRPPQKL